MHTHIKAYTYINKHALTRIEGVGLTLALALALAALVLERRQITLLFFLRGHFEAKRGAENCLTCLGAKVDLSTHALRHCICIYTYVDYIFILYVMLCLCLIVCIYTYVDYIRIFFTILCPTCIEGEYTPRVVTRALQDIYHQICSFAYVCTRVQANHEQPEWCALKEDLGPLRKTPKCCTRKTRNYVRFLRYMASALTEISFSLLRMISTLYG
jgi:hypothetical protein